MELIVTELIEDFESYATSPNMYQDSIANSGLSNIGRITWNNAIEDSTKYVLLQNEEQRQCARDYFAEFGAWTDDEISAWTDTELNALVIQEVASKYLQDAEERHCYIYSATDGAWYFYLGL